MMLERNIRCLTANQVELVEHLCCKGVLTAMVAADFLNLRVKEQIESASTDQDINESFVQWLRKAPEGAYHKFLEILEKTQQSHLAKLLREWGWESKTWIHKSYILDILKYIDE